MIVNSGGISPRVASVVAHVWYQSHTINYKCFTSPCFTVMFQKIILLGNKSSDNAALESGQNTSGAINFE